MQSFYGFDQQDNRYTNVTHTELVLRMKLNLYVLSSRIIKNERYRSTRQQSTRNKVQFLNMKQNLLFDSTYRNI